MGCGCSKKSKSMKNTSSASIKRQMQEKLKNANTRRIIRRPSR